MKVFPVDKIPVVTTPTGDIAGPQTVRPAVPPRAHRPPLGQVPRTLTVDPPKPEHQPPLQIVKPPPPKVIPGRGSRIAIQPPSTPPPSAPAKDN